MNRDELIKVGVDYDDGVERFGGNAQIFEKYLTKFISSDLMDKLEEYMDAEDYQGAFRIVHDLKGAAGNFSMSDFYEIICEITEDLRGKSPSENCKERVARARACFNKVRNAIWEEQL